MTEELKGRRSGIRIMIRLIGLVRPLLHIMAAASILGVLGYLCAIFLTILAGQGILKGLGENTFLDRFTAGKLFLLMGILAVFRGLLHYAEQYCNHFIAFKLLAIIRHKVFAALRKLCPAKLEGRDKGNLISIITTDIELLEVFYAHTISPIAIAFLTSLIMVVFIGSYHVLAGLFALAAYVVVGALIPLWNGKRGGRLARRAGKRFFGPLRKGYRRDKDGPRCAGCHGYCTSDRGDGKTAASDGRASERGGGEPPDGKSYAAYCTPCGAGIGKDCFRFTVSASPPPRLF